MRHGVKGSVIGFIIVTVILLGGAVVAPRFRQFAFRMPTTSDPQLSETTRIRIGETLDMHAEIARTDADRERGLSGRRALGKNRGMLFVFPHADYHAIWMPNMRFSIDLIWIDAGVVIGTTERLPVPTPGQTLLPFFHPPKPALLVLEVPAGTVAEHHITAGQRVEMPLLP